MNRRPLLLTAAVVSLHGAIALWFCFNGLLNADEAFYGLVAREVTAGAVPYRDFGFTQLPLVPYAQGLVMRIIGFGFLEQRLAAGLWAAATVVLGGFWLKRRHSSGAALWFAALLACSAGWMYNVHLGKTYAVTGFVVLAMSVVALGDLSGRVRVMALSALGAVCIGCRLPMAPFVAVLWLQMLFEQRSWREAAFTIGASAVSLTIVLGPFIVADADNFWFWVIGFHRESVALRNFYVSASELWGLAPALWLLAIAIAGGLLMQKRKPLAREMWVALALLVALAANLVPRGGYAEYAAPLVPAALLLLTMVGARHWSRFTLPSLATALVAAAITFYLAPPPSDSDIYGQVRQAANVLHTVLPHDGEFNGPATLLALETGHRVDPRLIMTPFGFTETKDDAWAAAHHLATPAWLDARMKMPGLPVYALTSQPRWNFGRSMPDFRFTSPPLLQSWSAELQRDYLTVAANGGFVIFVRREATK